MKEFFCYTCGKFLANLTEPHECNPLSREEIIEAAKKFGKQSTLSLLARAEEGHPPRVKISCRADRDFPWKKEVGVSEFQVDETGKFPDIADIEYAPVTELLSERVKRIKVFLDELDPSSGRGVKEPDIECGVLCTNPRPESREEEE